MIERELADGIECESCAATGEHRQATHRSSNPEWSGYALCAECAAEYDARQPTGAPSVPADDEG